MENRFKISLFLNEALIFFLIQIGGIIVTRKILEKITINQIKIIEGKGYSWLDILIFVILGSLIFILLIKFLKYRTPFKIFFIFIFFEGLFFIFNLWLGPILAIILALALLGFQFLKPTIFLHNLILGLLIISAGSFLGLSLLPWEVIILLIVLSIYDIIAVLKTRHMIRLFKGLAERGIVLAMIISRKNKNYLKPIPEIKPSENFVFLGTGDLVMPLVFASSLYRFKPLASFLVIIGAFLGIAFLHFFFLIKKKRRALPALPPIALGSILGYLISLMI